MAIFDTGCAARFLNPRCFSSGPCANPPHGVAWTHWRCPSEAFARPAAVGKAKLFAAIERHARSALASPDRTTRSGIRCPHLDTGAFEMAIAVGRCWVSAPGRDGCLGKTLRVQAGYGMPFIKPAFLKTGTRAQHLGTLLPAGEIVDIEGSRSEYDRDVCFYVGRDGPRAWRCRDA